MTGRAGLERIGRESGFLVECELVSDFYEWKCL